MTQEEYVAFHILGYYYINSEDLDSLFPLSSKEGISFFKSVNTISDEINKSFDDNPKLKLSNFLKNTSYEFISLKGTLTSKQKDYLIESIFQNEYISEYFKSCPTCGFLVHVKYLKECPFKTGESSEI